MDDIIQQLNLLNILRNRLAARELQAAHYGISVEPSITMEIEDLREQIDQLARNIEAQADRTHVHAGYLTNPFPTHWLDAYLEYLQSHTLRDFRRDQFVMLSVKPIQSEDPQTLTAIQEAMRSAFDIRVVLKSGTADAEPLHKAIANHRLAVLLGNPGIGKTTSLRFIALQQIDTITATHAGQLPIWVSLNKWVDQDMSASDFLWHEFTSIEANATIPRNFFDEWLSAGRLIVLLDGLNELPQRKLTAHQSLLSHDDRGDTTKEMISDPRENSLFVLAQHCRSRFIISCRIQEYVNIARWQEFIIQALNDEQIDLFAQRHLGPDKSRFDTMLTNQPRLRKLASIPFYLRSLILVAQSHPQAIPTDRFQLIQFMCRAALQREMIRRDLPLADAEEFLLRLSHDAYESMRVGFFGINVHPDPDDAYRDMLAYVQGAGLILNTWRDGPNMIYRYLHQLVQEALALIYIQTQPSAERPHTEAHALAEVGAIHFEWGKLKEAQENYLRALECCPVADAETLRGKILLNLSRVYRLWRNSKEAIKYATEAAQLSQALGPTEQLAEIYHELGDINMRLRQPKVAERHYKAALHIYEQLGETKKYAYELIKGLGDYYSSVAVYDIKRALFCYTQAVDILSRHNDHSGIVDVKIGMAIALRRWGEFQETEDLLQWCMAEAEALQLPHLKERAMYSYMVTLQYTKKYSESLSVCRDLFALAKMQGDVHLQYRLLAYGFAYNLANQSNQTVATKYLDEALAIAQRRADPQYTADIFMYGYHYVSLRAKDYQNIFGYRLKANDLMDDESRLHLDVYDKYVLYVARRLQRENTNQWINRCMVYGFVHIALFFNRRNPTSLLGKYLWRLRQWILRF